MLNTVKRSWDERRSIIFTLGNSELFPVHPFSTGYIHRPYRRLRSYSGKSMIISQDTSRREDFFIRNSIHPETHYIPAHHLRGAEFSSCYINTYRILLVAVIQPEVEVSKKFIKYRRPFCAQDGSTNSFIMFVNCLDIEIFFVNKSSLKPLQ